MTTAQHGGFTDVARAITAAFPERPRRNGQPYTRQQVHVWWCRRERNGFPQRYNMLTPSGKIKPLFNIQETVDWFRDYRPTRGVALEHQLPPVDTSS